MRGETSQHWSLKKGLQSTGPPGTKVLKQPRALGAKGPLRERERWRGDGVAPGARWTEGRLTPDPVPGHQLSWILSLEVGDAPLPELA